MVLWSAPKITYVDFGRSAASPAASWAAVLAIGACTLLSPIMLTSAAAQQANQPGFNPRQTEKYFDDRQSAPDRQAQPAPRTPTIARPEISAGGKPLFVLHAVSISGASALPSAQLTASYQPYLGKMVSQADLAAIAQAISDCYRAAGFHLSRAIIPPQDVADGRVQIEVIEGSITEVELRGDDAEQFGLRSMFNAVLAEHPSRLATLERQLLLINNLPGVRITDSSLEEIGGTSGHFRIIVQLRTWHVYAFAGLDNLGSSSVGPWQAYAIAAYNSLLRPGDTLAVNLASIANDPRQLGFGRLSYDTPVGTDGVRLGGSALYSEVRPGDFRRLYNDVTATEAFELHGSLVAIQSQRQTLTLIAAAGFSNVSESSVFGKLYDDHIRTATLTSDYRLQDDFGGLNYATLTYRQGLDLFGASNIGDDFTSRYGANANFSVLNFAYTRYQQLAGTWSAKLSMASQIASGPLFTSQQFYLGGAAFGRGYGTAEISGDNGLAGSLELRFDQATSLAYLSRLQFYAFTDSGVVWNDGYHPWDGLSLISAGGGIRFFFGEDLQADLAVAFPLSYRAPDNSERSARVLFSVSNALRLCPERGQGHCL
jgi:hemolysin activation/secretion protein